MRPDHARKRELARVGTLPDAQKAVAVGADETAGTELAVHRALRLRNSFIADHAWEQFAYKKRDGREIRDIGNF